MRRARARDETGFTLVELLVGVTILGILMAAITSAIMVGLKTTDDTSTRLTESHDAQLVQVWFPQDVQSGTSVSTTDTACAGSTPIVRISWTDSGVAKLASYVTATSGTERQLVRKYCENGSLVSSIVVAHHLAATGPTLSCPAGCSGTPAAMTLTVTAESGYSYSVTARRRSA